MKHCFTTLIALLIALAATPASARIITVNRNGGAQYTNIQAAVDAAAVTGDEIVVEPGVYTGSGDMVVDIGAKTVLLRSSSGPENTIIDGQNARACISCVNPESGRESIPTIMGFTIRNGVGVTENTVDNEPSSFGGGIQATNTSPVIVDCVFRNNVARQGGGIYFANPPWVTPGVSRPVLRDCLFDGNSAGWGGGICLLGSEADLRNCTFSGNSAEFNGGGLDSIQCLSLRVNACVFRQNTATDGGGWFDEDSSPRLINCSFETNTAEDVGGGFLCIRTTSNLPRLTDCIFTQNTAAWGGGMNSQDSSPQLIRCEFRNNTAEANDDGAGGTGGGVQCSGFTGEVRPPSIENCVFENNQAQWGGGMRAYNSTAELSGCTFSDNSAQGGGGGISSMESPLSTTNCVFEQNTALYGGGWSNNSGSPSLAGCTFRNNLAREGGGFHCRDGRFAGNSTTLRDCTFEGNRAERMGGGLRAVETMLGLSNCTFSGNSSESFGGGIFIRQSPILSSNCIFSQNVSRRGGAWLNERSSSRIRGCEFVNNIATIAGDQGGEFSGGGAIHNYTGDVENPILPTISGSSFCGNQPLTIFPVGSWRDLDGNQFCEQEGIGPFLRGNSNGDASLDLSDAISTLRFLFLGAETPTCQAAADSNADGNIDLTDAVYSLNFLFLAGEPLPPPTECALSALQSDIALGCENGGCE